MNTNTTKSKKDTMTGFRNNLGVVCVAAAIVLFFVWRAVVTTVPA